MEDTEFNTFELSDGSGLAINIALGRRIVTVPLSEIEGMYEVVRFKPEEGESFLYINAYGDIRLNGGGDRDNVLINRLNCFSPTDEGRKQAEAKAEQIRAIFKEGVW